MEGKIQIISDFVPLNDNPRMPVTDSVYVKGGYQVFQNLSELVNFHPSKMKLGMVVHLMNWPNDGDRTEFSLMVDPSKMVDSSGNSIVNTSNFHNFWVQTSATERSFARVYQYSAGSASGGMPTYPYTPATENEWFSERTTASIIRWVRFRDDDIDSNSDGVYDNWSVPIPVGQLFSEGDYIDYRFRRQNVSLLDHVSESTLTNGAYYYVKSGILQIQGNPGLNDVLYFGNETIIQLTPGRRFRYDSSNVYTFLSGCTLVETVGAPPRTIGGKPNNEPAGWTDTIPPGTDQLWCIYAQKNIYGNLLTDWNVQKIDENPNLIRYSNFSSPHPDTIADINTHANTGDPADLALIAAGWESVFNKHYYIATRSLSSGPGIYTQWKVSRIFEESGEYVDRVFKLFDVNLDLSSPLLVPPTSKDPADEGWSDTPLPETASKVNYVSVARKFSNGELKTPWSKPVPFTGRDVFMDVIKSTPGDTFYTEDGVITPPTITLQANLYRGGIDVWTRSEYNITYSWVRIFNNGAPDSTPASTSPLDDFYVLPSSGVIDTPSYIRNGQRLVVKPSGVTGMAVFRCTQTVVLPSLTLVFTEEISITDVSDGIDAKTMILSQDAQTVLYDPSTGKFTPEEIQLTAFGLNLNTNVYSWYRHNGSSWVKFTASDNNHAFPAGIDGKYLIIRNSGLPVTTVVPDLVFSVPGTSYQAQISSSSNALPLITAGSYFYINDHSDPANNGLYKVMDVITSLSVWEVNKISDVSPVTSAAESAEIIHNLSFLFDPESGPSEIRYAVSTHPTDPDLFDNDDFFSDFTRVHKLGVAGSSVIGEDAYSIILDNETHSLTIDTDTNLPSPGETGLTGRASTKVVVFRGTSKQNYPADYTVSVSSDNPGVTFAYAADGTDVRIYISSWAVNERRASCTINITVGSTTYTRIFTVTSVKDAPGALLLDINSPQGMIFTDDNPSDKTLQAILYDTRMSGNQRLIVRASESTIAAFAANASAYEFYEKSHIVLKGSSGPIHLVYRYEGGSKSLVSNYTLLTSSEYYTFRWNINSVWTTSTTDPWVTVTRSDVSFYENVTVEVSKQGVVLRTKTETIADVKDGRSYRAWTDYVSKPLAGQRLTTQNPTNPSIWPVTIGGVTWRLPNDSFWNTNDVIWVQEALETTSGYTWDAPYKVKGESGSPGNTGYFIFPMYIASSTPPSFGAGGSSSTLSQMIAAGWTSLIPPSGIIWRTERLWIGHGVTFDSSGNPSTSPVTGSVWTAPVRISGTDGVNGTNGVNGSNGWSPQLSLTAGANPGEQVLRLAGWVGGTGTPPSEHVNKFIGSAGFVTDVANAIPVSGVPVVLNYNSATRSIRWKYQNESDASYRFLFKVPYSNLLSYSTGLASSYVNPTVVTGDEITISNFATGVNLIVEVELYVAMYTTGSPATVEVQIQAAYVSNPLQVVRVSVQSVSTRQTAFQVMYRAKLGQTIFDNSLRVRPRIVFDALRTFVIPTSTFTIKTTETEL